MNFSFLSGTILKKGGRGAAFLGVGRRKQGVVVVVVVVVFRVVAAKASNRWRRRKLDYESRVTTTPSGDCRQILIDV